MGTKYTVNGKCYERAFNYLAERPSETNLKLVHGSILSFIRLKGGLPSKKKVRFGHAWVEDDLKKIVIDPSLGKRRTSNEAVDLYYKKYSVDKYKLKRYSYKEMYEIGLKYGGNYGPWVSMGEKLSNHT